MDIFYWELDLLVKVSLFLLLVLLIIVLLYIMRNEICMDLRDLRLLL